MLDKIFSKIEKFLPEKWRWVLSHEGFKRYFANTGWMFFGQMFSLLVSFFIGAWIARYLGPEKYGLVSYVVAFVGMFSFISTLGVDGVLNRELVSHPEKRDELMGTSFRIKLIGGLISFIVAVTFAFIINGQDIFIRTMIIMYGLSLFLQAPFVINIFFTSQVRAKESMKAQLAATFMSALLKVILIFSSAGVIWLLIIYILDSVWQGALLFILYKRKKLKVGDWKFKFSLMKELLYSSWPLMLSSAAAFIYLRIDQVIVGKMMGEAAVGIYAVSSRLTDIFYFIPVIISGSLFPAIVNAKKADESLYRRRLKNFYVLLAVVALLIIIPVTFLATPIINTLFGGAYLSSVSIFQIYIWSSLGYFIGFAVTQQLMAELRTSAIFLINLVAMSLNIILNLLFIPKFGLHGAAIATLIAYLVSPVWMFLSSVGHKKI